MTKTSPVVAPVKLTPAKDDSRPFVPKDEYQRDILTKLYAGQKSLGIEPTGWNVLIAVFVRPEKTTGGVFLADRTRGEDEFQGRVGVVLAMGPDAYLGDRVRNYGGPWVQPGDWVIFPTFENTATKHKYRGVVVAEVPDDRFTAIVRDPMDVY